MAQAPAIAIVSKGSQHQYWKAVSAGTAKAERDLLGEGFPVKVLRKSPLRDDECDEQLRIVKDFLQQGVQGLVVAPCDNQLMVAPIEAAARAGVPTVVIDSAVNTTLIVSFVATDNQKGGMLAANRMAEILKGAGRVLVLRYLKGSSSTEAREEGFSSQLRKICPGIDLIMADHYSGATRDSARANAEGLLARFGSDLQGIFTPNEPSTAGMLMALQAIQQAGKIALVGFDSSEVYLDSMRYKKIHGLVVQDPFRMGELGVNTLVNHLRGKSVPKRIDTGATLVTPENMDTPAIQALLRPPLTL